MRIPKAEGGKMTNAEIDRKICEFIGVKPFIKWLVGPENEDSSYMDFSSERNAEEWLANKKRFYPESNFAKAVIRRGKVYRSYSTDIAHAFEAVEKVLEEDGWTFSLECELGIWCAGFYRNDPGWYERDCCATGEIPEMAICLALLAVEASA
jgi:hypothetical protein